MNISQTINNPVGSDQKMPTDDKSNNRLLQPTPAVQSVVRLKKPG